MKYLKLFNESKFQEEMNFLEDLSLDLKDAGLEVKISESDPRFHEKDTIYLVVIDKDQIYCKSYPKDDMDWLVNKPIMLEFYKTLTSFGIKQDRDYKLYGGGLGATLLFTGEKRKSIRL